MDMETFFENMIFSLEKNFEMLPTQMYVIIFPNATKITSGGT